MKQVSCFNCYGIGYIKKNALMYNKCDVCKGSGFIDFENKSISLNDYEKTYNKLIEGRIMAKKFRIRYTEEEDAKAFAKEVRELSEKYNLPFFFVTDGASAISNNGCEAVTVARNNHIKWEQEHGIDSTHDWTNIDYWSIKKKV